MNQTHKDVLKKMKNTLFLIIGVLSVLVLTLSVFSKNVVKKYRSDGEYIEIENVEITSVNDGSVKQNEFRFKIDEIGHADTLTFFVVHHDVEVYIDAECVYTMSARENDGFLTSGGVWVNIPIYGGDLSRVVKVVLTPLYDDLGLDVPEFLIGSEIAIHNVTLHYALPAIVLSLYVIFAGILLLILAIYHTAKGMSISRLYALGVMAIASGSWRISYDRVAYILDENNSVFIYTLSIVSLMLFALSMLNSIVITDKNRTFIRVTSCIYGVIYTVQLVVQALGIADLRQTLKEVHLTLIFSAVTFMVDSFIRIAKMRTDKEIEFNFSWLPSIGVIADLVFYYISSTNLRLVWTLIGILCYTIVEGIVLLFTYINQRNKYEEMKTQLTLSRTTTMMSQIRSHFVFNVLNAISGMCKYDPEMADETVVRFARYLRNNIDIMEKDGNIPFSTDLQQVEDYIALEQVRFGDKIEFFTDIEVDDFMIPPLILQPVVENAIKHGISKKQGDGMIILRTRDVGENIIITVEDDGIGFDMAELEKEKSVGIKNIKFRLQHLVHGQFDITSEVGKGTVVTITIPKEVK